MDSHMAQLSAGYVHNVVENMRWPAVAEATIAEQLLPKTLDGINRLLMTYDREPLGVACRPIWQLVEFLKAEPDSPVFFPSGKWATIQRIQALLGKPLFSEGAT